MPKFSRSRAPERIDAAISHSTWVGLRPNVSLILGASTPSISQTLNIKVKAIVDRVRTVQREAWRSGGGAEPMECISWRGTCVRLRGPERSPPPGRVEGWDSIYRQAGRATSMPPGRTGEGGNGSSPPWDTQGIA